MRLSCNFVNAYTIAYRVQCTFARVHARIPNRHPREDPRAEVGEDVGVGPMEFQLNANGPRLIIEVAHRFRPLFLACTNGLLERVLLPSFCL